MFLDYFHAAKVQDMLEELCQLLWMESGQLNLLLRSFAIIVNNCMIQESIDVDYVFVWVIGLRQERNHG